MKKLALALVCFASIAFFASCNKVGQPTIQVLNQEGYVQSGATVDVDEDINFGFVVASSPVTNKELATLVVTIDSVEWANVNLAGKTEYTFTDQVRYGLSKDEIVGTSIITATVTDAAGETATATITLTLNQPAMELVENDFTWFRHGGNPGQGLEEFGLEWTNNAKEIFCVIKPVEGATLYSFTSDTWNEVTTDVEKAAVFSEALSMTDFRGVSAWSTKTYDYVIGTLYNGEYHLIHITHGQVDSSAAGTDITITGQAK